MSNYTKLTDFASKDALPSGNAAKIVKGTEIDDEFEAIETAIATKANSDSPALTGTPTAPTASDGTSTTQIATTAYVETAIADRIQDVADSVDEDNLNGLGIGTSGQILTSDGATGFAWVAASTISSPPTMQVFTTSGTWTKPTGCKKIKVTVTGGGGGGGVYTVGGGSGGGAGGTAVKFIDVSAISSVTVTVGTGGAGSTNASGAVADDGTDSIFGSSPIIFCTGYGGKGATAYDGFSAPQAGVGGIASGGDLNIVGGSGQQISVNMSGTGGASYWGGGRAGNSNGSGATATDGAYGSGGAGNDTTPGAAVNEAGADGVIIVEEFY